MKMSYRWRNDWAVGGGVVPALIFSGTRQAALWHFLIIIIVCLATLFTSYICSCKGLLYIFNITMK